MSQENLHGHPVLILGAGRGGTALLEMFLDDELVEVVAIADANPEAPGMALARKHRIPAYSNLVQGMEACRGYPDCVVYNLTHDDTVAVLASRVMDGKNVTSGNEAFLFWQMVTHLKRTKNDLERSQRELQAIIRHVMDGIMTIGDAGEILGFNPAAEKIFGYSQQDVLHEDIGRFIPDLMSDPGHLRLSPDWADGGRHEYEAVHANGSRFPLELSLSAMVLSDKQYYIGIVRDITERKQAEERVARLAHYDHLTGLPNRLLFLDRLHQSVLKMKRDRHTLALLFMDLDGFKFINDTFGHDVGDQLLQEAAQRLKMIGRNSDTVARMGGDEFVFLLPDIGSSENAVRMGNKIVAAISEPFVLANKPCRVGVSVGIALFPGDAETPDRLVKLADEAMYRAKQNGKNQCYCYLDCSTPGAS